MGTNALIVMHLSSLDSLQWQDPHEAEALAERLANAVRTHVGPVIVVDQAWSLKRGESDARAEFLRATEAVPVVRMRFDEETAAWGPFLARLVKKLEQLKVTNVTVAGLWYDPQHKSGCATEVYLHLKPRFNTRVEPSLVACE